MCFSAFLQPFGPFAGWLGAEISLVIIFLLLLGVQRRSGCYANRAQSTVSMAWFLALSSMLLLLASYFAGLQADRLAPVTSSFRSM